MINPGKELIPLSNADAIVSICEQVCKDVKVALELIEGAKLKLKNTFGEYRNDVFEDYKLNQLDTKSFPGCKDRIKNNAWRFIANKIQIRTLLSIKRISELDEQLDMKNAKSLPDVTEENIFSFINGTLGRASDLVEESLQEVFNIFRPHKDYHPFKTNDKFEIGRKVFLNGYIDTQYSVTLNYYHQKDLNALDKLFHLLDGKPAPQYPKGICTKISEAIREKKWKTETDYFKMEWFKKGSLHIEFKRLDLVAEINKRAGGMNLKGGL